MLRYFCLVVSAITLANAVVVKDRRYCEILFVEATSPSTIRTDVYNTFGLNTCPAPLWDLITPENAKNATTLAAVLNGPRYFQMDEFGPLVGPIFPNPQITIVGGIAMALVAQAQLQLPFSLPGPYTLIRVNRNADFVWKAGSAVFYLQYEQQSCKDYFIMQSYSQQIDPTLNQASLSTLSKKLSNLPHGWSFKSKTIKRDINVTTPSLVGGQATFGLVVQDELFNTYTYVGNLDAYLQRQANPSANTIAIIDESGLDN